MLIDFILLLKRSSLPLALWRTRFSSMATAIYPLVIFTEVIVSLFRLLVTGMCFNIFTSTQGHNKYQRENHDVITTGVFRENPRLYRARKCHDHENMRLEEACVKCFKVFCRKCERKDPCSLKSSKLPSKFNTYPLKTIT